MSGVGKLKLKGEDTAVAGGIKKKKKRSKKEIQEVHGQRVAQVRPWLPTIAARCLHWDAYQNL